MPTHFIGELSETRLFGLIKPLLDGRKSGMISIKGRDAGEIHIKSGSIVHAKAGNTIGEQAILSMMEWETGPVGFDWEVTTNERTTSLPTEQLLLSWSNREEEWKQIRAVVPSADIVYGVVAGGGSGDGTIHIVGDQWRIFAVCNGMRSVSEIADALRWDLFRTSKTISQMIEGRMLAKVAEEKVTEAKAAKEEARAEAKAAKAAEMKAAAEKAAELQEHVKTIEVKAAERKATEESAKEVEAKAAETTAKVVAPVEAQKPTSQKKKVNASFFPRIENELKKLMGPIAPILIDDKLDDLGESRDMFPHDRAEAFVSAMSEEITNAGKKKEFVKVMTEFLSVENRSKL
ncbi:MAG: hypothetical protein A4E62_01449 [Syntrophorhabdus sp. PtaU1.Bin002]|nr:MAG: hypothetical protein A4E62_01449 [Syntrophorhabdus sp. PtaU1.Bin002]